MNSNEAEANNKIIVKLLSLYFHDQANYRISHQGGFLYVTENCIVTYFLF
jgi:hypothetical protein